MKFLYTTKRRGAGRLDEGVREGVGAGEEGGGTGCVRGAG